MINAAQALKLRNGGVLVLDPVPGLLSGVDMKQVQEDMLRRVRAGGTFKSENPCNRGSHHGCVLLNPTRRHYGCGAPSRSNP